MDSRFSKNSLGYAQNVIDTIREPLLILDAEMRIVTASRSFCTVFKVNIDKIEGQIIYDLGDHDWDIPKLRTLLKEILPANNTFDDYEVEHEFPDIGKRIMLLNARKVYRDMNNTEMILLAIEDVTERREKEQKLKTLANHDQLTGCLNFRSTIEFITNEIARCSRYQRVFSLVMIDIDHLKEINDQYGHQAGNDVLIAFADVFKKNARELDIVGRYGGDEFIIVLPETNLQQALVVLERIQDEISRINLISPIVKDSKALKLQLSAGIAGYPYNARTLKELIYAADNAQLQAKQKGKNRVLLERRSLARFNPVAGTRIEMIAPSGKENDKSLEIANISEEGMLIISRQDIIGEEHLCRIYGPQEGPPFKLTCKVKHKIKSDDNSYHLGINFSNMAESPRENILTCIQAPEES